jgi:hypothetical protein
LLGLGMLAAEFLWACWVRKGAELIDSAFGTGDFSSSMCRGKENAHGGGSHGVDSPEDFISERDAS